MSKKAKSPLRTPKTAVTDATGQSSERPWPLSNPRGAGWTAVILGATTETARRLTILRLADVMARTGLARSTVYAYVASEAFPKPIPLGSSHAVGWIESEVEEWIVAQVRAARGADWGRGIDGVSGDDSQNAA